MAVRAIIVQPPLLWLCRHEVVGARGVDRGEIPIRAKPRNRI